MSNTITQTKERTMHGEAHETDTHCLVDGLYGHHVPQRFAAGYNMEQWGVKPEDAAILIAGPDHPEYDDTWDEVLRTAKRNGYCLSQDGDLFAVKVA